ncbi:WD40 repeat domain-containing protein [Rodentibacter pneumotropicus]|uniref:WD40 repeat domain-containing protein n=2 Tax=Rodentibacter pneumotropicus TaxID=758 RepID=A0A4S2P8N1_9PAST|nr:WD40 repeat domain-containing protein [Rodentibacter pneumotropicus]TGZ99360.1 WD40 repeat domain-containing protein [Rodentibacter pneumotropicus]THA03352.1 WD40 repeat domain-containing protein [Rodentibacter pneumotropicus]THA08951.1 WD40 repeat domain-containing protein [Rodentibacter pneumotropicus]THA16657.1 WD40 repeat domain-containing protein [Rodentibacter pneumotropicus]
MKNFFFLVLFIALGWGGYYVYENRHDVFSSTKGVRNLSISSDGRYVVSAHYGKKLVLWDIEKRTKTVLAERVNTNSPYFIPNSHDFMWQDKNNVVHIQNVEGQEITHFKHYKVERHLMSEDRTLYISADQTGEIYKGYGDDMTPIYTDTPTWRHYNFALSDKYFLTASSGRGEREDGSVVKMNPVADPIQPSVYKRSSYNGVVLWDRNTLKPAAELFGFGGRSDALFSPDGKWIIGGGENLRHYMWETANLTNRLRLADPDRGIRNPKGNDDSRILRVPGVNMGLNNPVTYAFVTETEFIEFRMSAKKDGLGEKYSPLYTVGDPWIKAFVEIGNNPVISTDFYEKSNSVASAPKAHILVTGQAYHGGINVYRYHPDKMELEKIWVAY